jgi:hypothetical protein
MYTMSAGTVSSSSACATMVDIAHPTVSIAIMILVGVCISNPPIP